MGKQRTHFIAAILDQKVITACGRECLCGPGDKFVHTWSCAKTDVQVPMQVTIIGQKVDCGTCVKHLTQ